MADSNDVTRLAALARINVTPEESASFAQEFQSILGYVSLLEKIEFSGSEELDLTVSNVFREDTAPHEERLHTEAIRKQFPESEEDLLVVKQIISHD